MDYDKNDQPVLLPLSDKIRTFREERARQPNPEPITTGDFDTSFNKLSGKNQTATLDWNQPTNQQQNKHFLNDVITVPGGAVNKMTQANLFHIISISGGGPTTIPTGATNPFLRPMPIPEGDPNTIPTGEISKKTTIKIKETIT